VWWTMIPWGKLVAATVLIAIGAAGGTQLQKWRDSETILSLTKDKLAAEQAVTKALLRQKEIENEARRVTDALKADHDTALKAADARASSAQQLHAATLADLRVRLEQARAAAASRSSGVPEAGAAPAGADAEACEDRLSEAGGKLVSVYERLDELSSSARDGEKLVAQVEGLQKYITDVCLKDRR